MCLGAIYWSRISHVYFAANRKIAEDAGFSDAFIYDEFLKDHTEKTIVFKEMVVEETAKPFTIWNE